MSVYFNGKKVSIASTTKVYGGEYNVTTEDKEDGTQKLIINTTPTSPAIVPTGTIDITENERVDVTKYAFANVNVESGITPTGTLDITSNGVYDVTNYASANVNITGGGELPAFMSAKNFTFNGNACTGYVGDNSLPEIIIPRSYSMMQETITMHGAPIIKDQIIPTLTSFANVVFCKTDGSNQVTYTLASQLSTNFNTDFPDNDVVLVSLKVFRFLEPLANKLNAILSTPFIASITETEGKTYYTNVEDFTSTLGELSITAYFSGSAIATTLFDGNDYQVTNIKGSGTNALNYRSGFKNYTNRIILLNNISTIDTAAFYNCENLSNIEIPNSVTSIENFAFQNCSDLPSITIPDSVTSIGKDAFAQCGSLTSITIGEGVTSIGDYAFRNCSGLTTMTILAITPPTLQHTRAISSATKKIYIPAGTLSAYQTATNWSRFASLFEELPA